MCARDFEYPPLSLFLRATLKSWEWPGDEVICILLVHVLELGKLDRLTKAYLWSNESRSARSVLNTAMVNQKKPGCQRRGRRD